MFLSHLRNFMGVNIKQQTKETSTQSLHYPHCKQLLRCRVHHVCARVTSKVHKNESLSSITWHPYFTLFIYTTLTSRFTYYITSHGQKILYFTTLGTWADEGISKNLSSIRYSLLHCFYVSSTRFSDFFIKIWRLKRPATEIAQGKSWKRKIEIIKTESKTSWQEIAFPRTKKLNLYE